jgi:hypothetical protein
MIKNTYVIDYTYSDLSEGEIAAHIAQMKAEAERGDQARSAAQGKSPRVPI